MGGKSSKQTTENKPPEWSKPLFAQSAAEAQKLYDSGSGGNVYQGNTVAGLSNTTMGGIQNTNTAANNWNMPGYQNMLKSAGTVGTNAGSQFDRASLPTSAVTNLSEMASGNYLKSGNPHFEDALRGQLDRTAAQTQSQFSGSGRYGSGANTDVLTNQLGNIRSTALSDQFNRDTQNMLAANSQIDSARNAAIGSANSSLQTQLGALQGQANIGNQAFTNQLAGANAQLGAGQILDDNAQKQLISEFTKWQSNDMKDWNRLGLLQSAAAGSAGNYGTNTQTQTQPFNALGGLGLLASLPKSSDRRLKDAIFLVDYKNGLPIYDFSYKGAKTRWRGVMAQDVLEIAPDAVVIDASGFYAVHYEALGLDMQRAA